MTNTTDDKTRRAELSTLIHEQADRFGLQRAAVIDAAAQFTAAGGEPSAAASGAYLPSGQSLESWISEQREIAPHWFALPVVSQPATDVSATKPKLSAAERRARATARLAQENGDDSGASL